MAKRLKSSNNNDSNNELPSTFNIYDSKNYHKVMINIPTEPAIYVTPPASPNGKRTSEIHENKDIRNVPNLHTVFNEIDFSNKTDYLLENISKILSDIKKLKRRESLRNARGSVYLEFRINDKVISPNNKVLDELFNKNISDIKIRISRMEALFIDIKKIFVNTSIMYIKENIENISKNLVMLRNMIIDREIDSAIIQCREIRQKLDDEYESLERVSVIQNEISASNIAQDSNFLTLKRKRN
jgi:hypothetical protein